MGGLSGIFGGGSNAPGAAMPYYQQIPGVYDKYLQPWIDRGNQAYGLYSGQLQKMLSDPQGFINDLMSGYTASPEYQNNVAAATTAANNAGAAGGTLGTGAEQSSLASKVHDLSQQDQQQYLQNVEAPFMTALSGEGGLSSQGFNASGAMAQALAENLRDEGGLAYQEAEDKDNGLGGLISGIAGILGPHIPSNWWTDIGLKG